MTPTVGLSDSPNQKGSTSARCIAAFANCRIGEAVSACTVARGRGWGGGLGWGRGWGLYRGQGLR